MSDFTNLHNLAFSMSDGFVAIQECDGGYDYSVYDAGFRLLDGGVYDCGDKTIMQALGEIMQELRSGEMGEIRFTGDAVPVDYDELMEKVENVQKTRMKEAAAMSEKMMHTYEEFQELMTSALKDNSPTEVEVSYFLIHKPNLSYHAVRIAELTEEANHGIVAAPIFNMDQFYEKYLEGETIENLAKEIISIRNGDNGKVLPKPDMDIVKSLCNYELVKDRLLIRAIGTEKNEEFLAEHPHRIYGDIAFVCYILIDTSDEGEMSVCISNGMMRSYEEQGVCFDQLFKEACRNSKNLYAPHIVDIYEMYGKGMFAEEPDIKMYAVSNKKFSFGAGVLLYEGFLKEFSNEFCDGGDLIIIPSSVHETIIAKHDPEHVSLEYMEHMISSVNETLPPQLILSSHLYYYEASTGFFGLASEKMWGGVLM